MTAKLYIKENKEVIEYYNNRIKEIKENI